MVRAKKKGYCFIQGYVPAHPKVKYPIYQGVMPMNDRHDQKATSWYLASESKITHQQNLDNFFLSDNQPSDHWRVEPNQMRKYVGDFKDGQKSGYREKSSNIMWIILYQNPEVWPLTMTYDKGPFIKITEANFSNG